MPHPTNRLPEATDRARANVQTTEQTKLAVEGMTCASCAQRVERVLAKQPGVERAEVNFATARAEVVYRPEQVSTGELATAVAKIGYRIVPAGSEGAEAEDVQATEQRLWLRRVLLAWPLAIVVLVLSLVLMAEPWARWSIFALTVPVQFVTGWPFLRTAAERARTLSASMDTLIALGTLAAFFYSTYELFAGGDLYFDTAALIISFILLGRFFEARAKGRASAAIKKLLELGAKEARLLVDGREELVPIEQVGVGDQLRVRPGEKIPVDGGGRLRRGGRG